MTKFRLDEKKPREGKFVWVWTKEGSSTARLGVYDEGWGYADGAHLPGWYLMWPRETAVGARDSHYWAYLEAPVE